jgi:hypothetical protein
VTPALLACLRGLPAECECDRAELRIDVTPAGAVSVRSLRARTRRQTVYEFLPVGECVKEAVSGSIMAPEDATEHAETIAIRFIR